MAIFRNNKVQSVWDLTTRLYGDLSYVFKFIADNNIQSFNDLINTNIDVYYDDTIVFIETTKTAAFVNIAVQKIKKYKIRPNQTVYDVVMQLYGSLESVFKFLQDNPQIFSVNSTNLDNIEVVYTEQNNELTNFFKKNIIFINTGIGAGGRNFDETFDRSFD